MFIFLDFDGVLRRVTSDPSRFDMDCLEQFEMAIRPLNDIKIVISSTWRLAMSVGELRKLFTADIANRIVGVTPEYLSYSDWPRYKEIILYLQQNGIENTSWLAIDDDSSLFPCGAPLVHVNENRGFDSASTARLWELSQKISY